MDSISGISGITDYYSLQSENTKAAENAEKVTGKVGGISKDSSREEVKEAVRSFESYFLEQVIKQQKESVKAFSDDDDKDLYASQIEDMYSDRAIQQIAESMVKQNFEGVTDKFTDQIMRNYGIEEEGKA
ncbi:MAG: hypothetical protein II745_00945 [Lachnospiraceae bacterium]|jgi:Rod binding domain-containing protein|nr:hypothetical protein [Lachnospiraceae bacterium]